ncbi:6-hydroxymethylpterin diphosphokinase MptE-like protein [Ferroplasma sp.]|uniref:6-hydroxymethylpterin diphosphokinase MptE-like protein n=1 Tax=Ferroplasma sp. TaxID=2591003 RepID=UPI002622A9C5|nr:6-hydroxymethylpterin diphosphokinase MptE-like protein [Ferroplasma sp.]
MKFEDWFPFYLQITDSLGINRTEDYRSSLIIHKLIHNDLSAMDPYRGRNAFVIGNGPHLNDALTTVSGGYTIVADSAIDTYTESLGIPDIIVSDMDGNMDNIIGCYNRGTTVFLHAHGDNIEKIWNYAKYFPDAMATTQNIPMVNLYNFGGFSDGDRAAFLADHLSANNITLVGFDFNHINNKNYYDSNSVARKKLKLAWAKYLLTYLANSRGRKFSEGSIIEI